MVILLAKLPEDAIEKENDYDVIRYFPTGYHDRLAGVKPGDSVVIYGAGPVG
jgi:threonine dehydrogenase-like Zn-dependent dehydrogenase